MAKDNKKIMYLLLIVLAIYLYTKKPAAATKTPYRHSPQPMMRRSPYSKKEGYAISYPTTTMPTMNGGAYGGTVATALGSAKAGLFDPSKGIFQIYNSMATYPTYGVASGDMNTTVQALQSAWANYLVGISGVTNATMSTLAQATVNMNDAKAGFDAARRDYLNRLKALSAKLLQFNDARSAIAFTNPSTAFPNAGRSAADNVGATASSVGATANSSAYVRHKQSFDRFGVPHDNTIYGSDLMAGASVVAPMNSKGMGTTKNTLYDIRPQPYISMNMDPLAGYLTNPNPILNNGLY
jgi:hypothetical protein